MQHVLPGDAAAGRDRRVERAQRSVEREDRALADQPRGRHHTLRRLQVEQPNLVIRPEQPPPAAAALRRGGQVIVAGKPGPVAVPGRGRLQRLRLIGVH